VTSTTRADGRPPALPPAAIPSADVLVYGTDRTLADFTQITEYFRRLDRASARVRLFNIGRSTEGREMFVAAISSEANLAALDRYRQIARRLADGRGLSDAEAHALAREGRTIAWLDMGLHATEVAHAQVSAEVARAIAGDEGAEMRRIRDNVIVVLMPVMNPDGLDIVAKWYRAHVGTPFETSPLPVISEHAGTTTTATGSCRTCRRRATSPGSSTGSGFRSCSTTTTSPASHRRASGRRRWTIR
jgi:hypothetical protein